MSVRINGVEKIQLESISPFYIGWKGSREFIAKCNEFFARRGMKQANDYGARPGKGSK